MRTEKTYLHWIKRYIYFHRLTHPEQMGAQEVRTTPIYTHVIGQHLAGTRSPMDEL
ncbi:phage integrase N-terminal SAM-like domain-containing protein [Gallaecimonas sp. GXIMD1310]|uniref:phage integrase N-terminal SAM-like domain-containing protein n=1 Tax=Gallaecimonas sp. GXIMD1310 TaxID=3131926 RepID=UPI0032448275